MRQNFILWIVNLILSFLLSYVFPISQSKAFFAINIVICVSNVIAYCIVFWNLRFIEESKDIICIITLKTVFAIFIILCISFVSLKVLHIDFYMVYQFTTLIMCIFSMPVIDFFEAFK